jgi:hypothetical protein
MYIEELAAPVHDMICWQIEDCSCCTHVSYYILRIIITREFGNFDFVASGHDSSLKTFHELILLENTILQVFSSSTGCVEFGTEWISYFRNCNNRKMKGFRHCEAEITPFRGKRATEPLELISQTRRRAALEDINLVKYLDLSFRPKGSA